MSGQFVQEETDCYYIYALTVKGRTQRGIVCCTAIDDYLNDTVKKHENTREEKELDRIRHVDTCSAQTGPIFMAYRRNEEVRKVIDQVVAGESLYDFVSEDGVRHTVWKIEDRNRIQKITELFGTMKSLYIADGHHRAASAVKAGLRRRAACPGYTGTEEFNYFLSVLFSEEELCIYDYNRVVHKIPDEVRANLKERLAEKFETEEAGAYCPKPEQKGQMGMYVDGNWYRVQLKPEYYSDDAIDGLDVSVLQNEILEPVFGIKDQKSDSRLEFVGGIRGTKALEEIVDREKDAAAFLMYPTSMKELLRAADFGRLMPPKSTWFEPKLRSGLFIHEF